MSSLKETTRGFLTCKFRASCYSTRLSWAHTPVIIWVVCLGQKVSSNPGSLNCNCISNRIEMFYLTTHSTHFIYGYMASDIWLRTILIVRKETRCRHIGYCYRLTARVLLYAPSHKQDSTYHGLCYTSRGALAGTRNSSMGPPHEGSIRRPMSERSTS